MKKLCMVGLGYIGLPTAAMFASRGFDVVGVDINPAVCEAINEGRAHFHEPDLQMLLSAAVSTHRLRAQPEPIEADAYIIAVPTPFREGNKPDMTYVEAATKSIAPHVRAGSLVILESTSPVGSTEAMAATLAAARPDLRFPTLKDNSATIDVHVAHCPERILPGQMLRELVANDRIIGGMTDACSKAAQELYANFVSGRCHFTDARTAEFVKLTENAFRDVNIAFANELSMICDRIGVDVWAAIQLANRHPRVNILQPGAGVGGHCIAVDPWFIVDAAPEESRLIRTAREVNDHKPMHVLNSIRRHADRFKTPVIACYGVTYKPDVDDLRESPALHIVEEIARWENVKILVCDPFIEALPKSLVANKNVRKVDAATALKESDIAVLLVSHGSFRQIEANQFLNKVVVDAAGLLSAPRRVEDAPRSVSRL